MTNMGYTCLDGPLKGEIVAAEADWFYACWLAPVPTSIQELPPNFSVKKGEYRREALSGNRFAWRWYGPPNPF